MVQGCKRLAIVAHSMGSRILTAALDKALAMSTATEVAHLLRTATLVFAAADVGRREFVRVMKEDAAQPSDSSRRLRIVYFSSHDAALTLSTFINIEGRAGSRLLLEDSFETIDATASSGRHFSKHGYWAQSKPVLADLRSVIIHGHAAHQRLRRNDNSIGTLRHCSCHPVDPRPHYVIHRP